MTVGLFQIVIIALIMLLLFGRGRISQSLGELGEGVRAFRHGLREGDEPASLALESGKAQRAADK